MADQPKKPGVSLFINKSRPTNSRTIQSVFGDDDSDDDTGKTPGERFQSKYGNLKAKDERVVKKVLEEDPDIYDYDGVYDSMQQKKRIRLEKEEETKKVDKTPRYTNRLLEAKKKRDLEKLLRDERTQEKERVAEGEEFKGKEVFITSAYRKQLEETVKFRKELESSDNIDDRTDVRGQQMWRENFGKKILEEKMRDRFGYVENEGEKQDEKPEIRKEKIIKEEKETSPEDSKEGIRSSVLSRSNRVISTEDDFKKMDLKRPSSHHRNSDRHRKDSSRHEHKRDRQDSGDRKRKSHLDDEKEEVRRRMNAIRNILKQRNGEEQIKAARTRYIERRNAGVIVLPV